MVIKKLDAKKIQTQLESPFQLEIFESIASTQTYLQQADFSKNPLRICFAEMQTAGQGRFDRSWHSPFGKNIYVSFSHVFYKNLHALSGLSLLVSLSICKAIEKSISLAKPLGIKWPNDILLDQKKVCGNLTTIQSQSKDFCRVIIGIGVNVNMEWVEDEKISQPWASLGQYSAGYLDRNDLCAKIINQITSDLVRFEQTGLQDFLIDWKNKDRLEGQWITLNANQKKYEGKACGINTQGHLILEFNDASRQAFSSGEASLNKVD